MPSHAEQLLATAQLHYQSGHCAQSIEVCRRLLAQHPHEPRAWLLWGLSEQKLNQPEQALEHFAQAARVDPRFAEPHFLIALHHHQQRRLPMAVAGYRAALQRQPNHPQALNNLGRVLLDLGDVSEGTAVLNRAVGAAPANPGAYCNLGDAHRMAGDFKAALACQQKALQINPHFAEAHSNLGVVQAKLGNIPAAMESMRQALAINPKMATPHYNLARIFQDQNDLDSALSHCRSAVQLRPGYGDALSLLGNLIGSTGDASGAMVLQRQAIIARPDHAGFASNLLLSLHYTDDHSPQEIFEQHLQWARQHAPVTADASITQSQPTGVPVRIGYVSPNFCTHSVANFIGGVLAAHDRARFQVFAYADVPRPDVVTNRLKKQFDIWRDTTGWTDQRVIQQIRADGIDVLIDLAGHTADNRLKVFAARPARVQFTWLGYPDTTGMKQMDYRITDAITDPPGADAFQSEKLLRVEGSCWAFDPPVDLPAVAATPALTNGFVTFGSFNNLPKITPAVIEIWAGVLQRMPGSRLVLKAFGLGSDAGRNTIGSRLSALGITADRFDLLAWIPGPHLQAYDRIDVAFDTFPYNGTTTTCEALLMGVPVVSFTGQTHTARVGASLLANAGLPELIAADAHGYQELAIKLASDVPALDSLRQSIRGRFLASPVCDAHRMCRALEAEYARAVGLPS